MKYMIYSKKVIRKLRTPERWRCACLPPTSQFSLILIASTHEGTAMLS